jgi:hypothetical protein
MNHWKASLAILLLLAGCASIDGSGLVPGKSTAADVQAQMGAPVERQPAPGGGFVWWYPVGPFGFHSYAVTLGPDNVVRGVEQRLTVENVKLVRADEWTKKEVRELFGPPFFVSTLPRLKREVWEYQILDVAFKWKLWVQFSPDGVVREVLQIRHPDNDPPGADTGKD